MNLGCWNIQGIRTNDQEVFQEMITCIMDIPVSTETKKREGNEDKCVYMHFYRGKKKVQKNIQNCAAINERLITIDLKLKRQDW